MVEVAGRADVRGNEPFTELVVETPDQNVYVLKFGDRAEREALQDQAPVRIRVRGELYRADWDGRPFAHLHVLSWDLEP